MDVGLASPPIFVACSDHIPNLKSLTRACSANDNGPQSIVNSNDKLFTADMRIDGLATKLTANSPEDDVSLLIRADSPR